MKFKEYKSLGKILKVKMGFPCGSVAKNPPANAGDTGSVPGLERSPGGGHDNPLQYACLENSHGQRSLAGYSPWGHKELATIKHGTFLVYFRILFLWHYFN